MRTKTLLVTAMVAAAGIVSSFAQGSVYSVNVVGYVTKKMQPGFNLLANPLIQTNSSIAALIPGPPEGTTAYILAGGAYNILTFDSSLGGWDPEPTAPLNLGAGLFILNPEPTTFDVTFVGEVAQGKLTNNIPVGFSMQSSKVPQEASLTALGFKPAEGDTLYQFHNDGIAPAGYNIFSYDSSLGGWDPAPDPVAGPTLAVGEAVIYLSPNGGSFIIREFTVN